MESFSTMEVSFEIGEIVLLIFNLDDTLVRIIMFDLMLTSINK